MCSVGKHKIICCHTEERLRDPSRNVPFSKTFSIPKTKLSHGFSALLDNIVSLLKGNLLAPTPRRPTLYVGNAKGIL